MTHIKRLVMHGFKSFASKTEIPLSEGINVILGPNGSGKSNITDALCFVLGRMSIKSMRATKAKNLIFLGTKAAGPAKEAAVELVFDNTDKTFSIDEKEISVKRIVRRNGQSVYKINGKTETRQEVLTLLSQGGIDPDGFNIILQGEIQHFAKMPAEERRGIIEEVAGISVYESRKEKSLRELEKTEEKLKEVETILKARTAYLNNLEQERQEALKYKKIEKDIQNFKASILYSDLNVKKKEVEKVNQELEEKDKQIAKIKQEITNSKGEIEKINSKIQEINSTIQKTTGLEQEKLNREIANLRADLAGIGVKVENFTRKVTQIERQKEELKETVKTNSASLETLKNESPTIAKKQKEIETKKKELEVLEDLRKKFYMTKSELRSLKERLQEKSSLLQSYQNESEFALKQSDHLSQEIFDMKSTPAKILELSQALTQKKEGLEQMHLRERELDKIINTNQYELTRQDDVVAKISKIDICPLCKSKITADHIKNIKTEIKPTVEKLEKELAAAKKELSEIFSKKENIKKDIETLSEEIQKRKSDVIKLSNIENKKEQIKSLQEKIEQIKKELGELIKRKKSLEENFDENSNIEQKYETARVEVQEISLRSEENVNSEITFKQREIDRAKIQSNQLNREFEEVNEELVAVKKIQKEKEVLLEEKRKQEEALTKKCDSFIKERDNLYRQSREKELELSKVQNTHSNFEQGMNLLKIDKARSSAEVESLEIELLEFKDIEIIKMGKDALKEKLNHAQEVIIRIGSVNMRALETYDQVKADYDQVQEKVNIISKEKESVLRIIHEIDIKKKKAFISTLEALNELFSRNFAQISTKGQVSLEVEDKKEPFNAGVSIIVKTGQGKYFDITSLSGGEQTMVALSLIFAIQELKPYSFYILDEIDAALDKRNSERLAGLLKRYMQRGQYIVITHNDEVITNATNLFGISMHEGISKVVSMKI